MTSHPSPLHWPPHKQQSTGKASTVAGTNGGLCAERVSWGTKQPSTRSSVHSLGLGPCPCPAETHPLCGQQWPRQMARRAAIAHAVGPCGAVGRRPGNWPKPHACTHAHTHAHPTPACPVASDSLWLPQLRGTDSFKNGWPNGIPGDRHSPQGEQVELRGSYIISVSVRLQEERGRVREWVGRRQAPHFPQCWQKAELTSRQT